MKNNWIVFFGSIAFFIVGAICIIILKLLFGEYYVDAVVALIMLTNVYFMIKNGIKKSDFSKKNLKEMDVTIGGVSLIQAIFVFIMWIGYNATRG
ncbi:hypothetical protein [Campylobacter concisus]|jgi:hypothetical protein|uniref:hypothetical protein n=1 Tax=Campylobacter concisus TaxID=199 RepID=UPI000A06A70A|nr:hypothetical protein [Campylobacter concisus]ORI00477.1 hypothetical protein A3223_08790 [Campylobacter concisus]ORI07674.1 hypothetical protein A3854_05335 [Campylobacter concisus]